MTYSVTNAEFISVIDAHKALIYKVCNAYCKESADRDDLAQEIVYQLFRSWTSYKSDFKHSTWIYRVALNVAISFYRGKVRTGHTVLLGDSFLEVEDTFQEDMEAELSMLHVFIQELKPLDRALMLLFLEDKSHREIGAILGITESNVGTKFGRIKSLLKQKFKASGWN